MECLRGSNFIKSTWGKQIDLEKKNLAYSCVCLSKASFTVYAYSPDKQLCVVQTLNRYLEMTKDRRDPSRTQLLLSYRKPYKEIASSTVSGWIKKVLQLANVDTNVFKGHSTRSASTSKVNLKGLALSDILHRESWSRASTWQKFYDNQIIPPEEKFQHAFLKNN